ncbi:MMPL family transporter [Mycolicibacterium palauense]|uniref:MMPL family transporter n=1 Tax=Mycolicibacterium palauense TaxID=2034511 RepID=UPI000BFEDAD7|nr:MMPL family transporter [Mycolicibacterium palauense]
MLHRIAMLAIGAPRRVLAAAALVAVAAAVFGIPVAKSLSAGGYLDPTASSAHATRLLTEKFGRAEMQLIITVTAPGGAGGPAARSAGTDIVTALEDSPEVVDVASPWTSPPQAAAELRSADGRTAMIVAGIAGGENDAQKHAETLQHTIDTEVLPRHPDARVLLGGSAMVYAQINQQNERDLLLMESIAIPLSFLVLVWVFGGLVAAALPIVVGALAIVGAMSVLRFVTLFTDVSIFALNLSTAMGLALAIDYTLLIVSRYRDEVAGGAERGDALVRTMTTAGRTVIFSAVTVALSMSAMVLFPMYFLKSFAYAGIATVAFAALAAIIVAPAAIALFGARLDALDLRRLGRRALHRPEPTPKPVEQLFWYRSTRWVMRHAVPVGLAGVTLLLVLGAPFLGVKWGFPDDRVLPESASSRQVGDELRTDFASNTDAEITAVVPDATGLSPADLESYAADVSRVADVGAVTAPTGTFVAGRRVGPPAAATGFRDGSAFLTVESTAPLFSDASDEQLRAVRQVPGPGGRAVELTGTAEANRQSVEAITSRLPLVLGLIAGITFVLLYLLTGSVILPLKALVLNMLSLSAAFGALVWIFQDGHLGALGTTPTGTLVATIPVLLFCIAFGLSMDYEVFLLARIREFWLDSDRTRAANDESVALGLARTGRVITAAALIMSISFAALIAAQVSFMRMFGLGLTLAVLVDATLVRMMLVPAFMRLFGRWNWWAPAPLARLHDRIGISESGPQVTGPAPRHAAPEPVPPDQVPGAGP